MSQLGVPSGKFDPKGWQRHIAAVRKAVSDYDVDSGWILTPVNKTFSHKAGVLPKTVLVYASDSKNGDPYSHDTVTSVTSSQVVFSGPKAYCRILVDK